VRALVSAISTDISARGRDTGGGRSGSGCELDLALGQAYAPEFDKRCRPHLRPSDKSYRIDETYIRIRGEDRYLYRTLDSTGQTIHFLLMAGRETAAAERFLVRVMEDLARRWTL